VSRGVVRVGDEDLGEKNTDQGGLSLAEEELRCRLIASELNDLKLFCFSIEEQLMFVLQPEGIKTTEEFPVQTACSYTTASHHFLL